MFIYGRFIIKNSRQIILLTFFIFSFSLGILRYEIKEVSAVSPLQNQIGEKVNLTGLVIDEPAVKDKTTQLTVQVGPEKVLVSTGLFPEFKYGDMVQVEGKLEQPENFETDTGNEFDYIGYLAKDDIFYQVSFAQVQTLSAGHGSFLKTKLFAFKKAFMNKVNLLIKEPESSLLGGLLLGAKNSLGKDLQNDFRIAGVSHIVALSGYNITIVADGIMIALAFLPRAFAVSFGVLGIILFAIMTGGTATVIRASIMALLVLLAKTTNRKYDIRRALILAGVFMLIQNPKVLVFDISFQLSFLATLALIYVSPIVEKKMTFITEKYKLRELIVASISTQIFVLPFLFYKMGLLSIYGLFTNVFILPVMPLIMLLGFMTGLIALFSITLAIPIAFICSLLLSYMLGVIYLFSHAPFASLAIKNFPLGLAVLIYVIYFIIIWRAREKSRMYEKLQTTF